MVVKVKCPECGKGQKLEVLEILGEKKYRMLPRDRGCKYFLTSTSDEGYRGEKIAKGCVR